MLRIEQIVFSSYSQHPADATRPRGVVAANKLAVIHRPVRQIVGRHGNNLVPSLHEAGGPDGGSVRLGDVMHFTAAASSPSFPVGSNRKPKLSRKWKRYVQHLFGLPKSSTLAHAATLWGFAQDVWGRCFIASTTTRNNSRRYIQLTSVWAAHWRKLELGNKCEDKHADVQVVIYKRKRGDLSRKVELLK